MMTRAYFIKPSAVAIALALILSPMGEAAHLAAQRVNLRAGSSKGGSVRIINPARINTIGGLGTSRFKLSTNASLPGSVAVTPTPAVAPVEAALSIPDAALTSADAPLGEKSALAPEPLSDAKTLSSSGPTPRVVRFTSSKKEKKEPVLTRLSRFVTKHLSLGSLFDSSSLEAAPAPAGPASRMGILPTTPAELPNGTPLDQEPVAPSFEDAPGVSLNNFSMPDSLETGGIFDRGPIILQADARNPADIERALRELVDNDAISFGITTSDLLTVHVKHFAGKGQQADTVFVYFRQQKNGLPVHGTYLSFTVKVIRNTPILMASMARLYSQINADTSAAYTDDQLMAIAKERIGVEDDEVDLAFIEKKIIHQDGAWRAANLYVVEDLPFMIAVDVATGEAFAWDARLGVGIEDGYDPAPAQSASGKVSGRYVHTGPTRDDSRLKKVPLPFLTVTVDGKDYITDAQGRFTATIAPGKGKMTATLSGKYTEIQDQSGKPVTVSATLSADGETVVVFNPKGHDEAMIAQVNAYVHVTRVHEWLKERGVTNELLERILPVRTNIDNECNAYYTPGRPSLNFFRSSANCSNSAYDSVTYHEFGHYVDDMIGGIVNGGLSEGWGDILSMFIIGNPIVGTGFLKQPREGGKDYIRNGTNTHKYEKFDEAHAQGQVWMGFAWKLRKALIASLGAAVGAALVETLIIPTIYAKAADIPAAISQVLINDMDKNGNIPHEKEIRAAAKAHGIELPKNPFVGPMNSLLLGLFPQAGRIDVGETRVSLLNEETEGLVTAQIPLSAGMVVRQALLSQIESFCKYHGIELTVEKARRGVLSSDYRLGLKGDRQAIEKLVEHLERLGA